MAETIGLAELREYLDRQIGYTLDNLENPVSAPAYPSPEFWRGYFNALSDMFLILLL